MMSWFCDHDYKSHAKETHNYDKIEIVEETRFWLEPLVVKQKLKETVEILLCSKCGKTKKIKY